MRRRHRSAEEKRRIVEQTLVKGASVARVAREHGVNANQLFNWRLLYKKGRLGGRATKLLPATIEDRGRTKQEDKRRWSLEAKQQIVAASRALRREHRDQPLDRLRQPRPPLMQRILVGQVGKQVGPGRGASATWA